MLAHLFLQIGVGLHANVMSMSWRAEDTGPGQGNREREWLQCPGSNQQGAALYRRERRDESQKSGFVEDSAI